MIYLDSAATSLYKPETVQTAVLDAINRMASPGRGSHTPAMEAASCCYRCRELLATLFHMDNPERVVFTFNATHGLNIAIRNLVKPGMRVMISGYEHNAVTRPVHAIGAARTVIRTPLFDQREFLREAERQIDDVDVVICCHVSNVFGYILPVEALSALCRERGKPLIIDASQSAGALDIDCSVLNASYIAMPGHKGLLGPQGTGVLLCQRSTEPLLYGGSGSDSRIQTMPDYFPDRLEAGTQNVAGIAGLAAGVEYLLERGVTAVGEREQRCIKELAGELSTIRNLELFVSPNGNAQGGVLSVLPKQCTCEALGEALNQKSVAVRTGLHCAPLAHETAGTLESGTVRFSVSPFTTRRHILCAAKACREALAGR